MLLIHSNHEYSMPSMAISAFLRNLAGLIGDVALNFDRGTKRDSCMYMRLPNESMLNAKVYVLSHYTNV